MHSDTPTPQSVQTEQTNATIAENKVEEPAETAVTPAIESGTTAIDGLPEFHLSSSLGRVIDTCQPTKAKAPRKDSRLVLILKQWHTSPGINTVPARPGGERAQHPNLPQAKNQTALYQLLDEWISTGLLRTVLVEGCEYGIARGFERRFNGWNLRALEKRATEPDYAAVITHLGLKLKAKLGPLVEVECADDDELIRAHDLAFSDARGVAGFLGRMAGKSGDDPVARDFLARVIELYGLPPTTTVEEGVTRLREEFKSITERINNGFSQRNQVMLRHALRAPSRPLALVVGGAHAADLKERLEKANAPCVVIEPVGYPENDALLPALNDHLNK